MLRALTFFAIIDVRNPFFIKIKLSNQKMVVYDTPATVSDKSGLFVPAMLCEFMRHPVTELALFL